KAVKAGIRTLCIHKGLMPADYEQSWAGVWKYNTPWDIAKAAKDWPQLNFVIYHGGLRAFQELPDQALAEFDRSGEIKWASDLAPALQPQPARRVPAADAGQVRADQGGVSHRRQARRATRQSRARVHREALGLAQRRARSPATPMAGDAESPAIFLVRRIRSGQPAWRKRSAFTSPGFPETCASSCRPAPSTPWHPSCCSHLGDMPEMTTRRTRTTLILLYLAVFMLPPGAEPATRHLRERGADAQAETQADLARPPE